MPTSGLESSRCAALRSASPGHILSRIVRPALFSHAPPIMAMRSRIRLSGCALRAQSQAAQPAPSEGRKTRNRNLTCPNEIAESSARYSKDFLKAVRNHWAIENRLHRIPDVRMREDDLRNRTGRGPENLAAVHSLVVSIVHLMDDKLSIRRRLLRAAQVSDCRLELIANAAKLAEKL